MVFWICVALLCSGYCLYKVHQLEASSKQVTTKDENKKNPFVYKRLKSFMGKTCEVYVKKPMIFIDVMQSVKGTILEVDEEWVMIIGKKEVPYLIRLTMVKDVAQIL